MLASTITPSTFDSFGKSTYHKIKQSEYNHFIEDLCDFNNNSYTGKFIKKEFAFFKNNHSIKKQSNVTKVMI